ncbi:MAG: magnesium/cobalt transporter CorA [Pirellulales bacterium]
MSKQPRKIRKESFRFRRRLPAGASPGTIIVNPLADAPVMQLMAFDEHKIVERQLDHVSAAKEFLGQWPVVWINVEGLGDARTLEQLGQLFGLHRLALEDVVNIHQRSKVETYDGNLFIVARMPRQREEFDTEQLSLFLGADWVLTLIEDPGDCFDGVRRRVRESRGRIRSVGPDYLVYALLDAVIDSYFPLLEQYGERLDELEDEAILRGTRQTVAKIHATKTDLLHLRRAVWPFREALNHLVRDEHPFIKAETRVYLRDCYDHTVQMIDLIEVYRELGSDLRDLYLTSVSNRMNEVMKVLTVITTIFMPLTLIVGIYGMNFNPASSPWNMPELNWRYGYPAILALLSAVTAGMLWLFRRKGWLGPPREKSVKPSRAE